jgi:hypothetical protein
MSVLQPLHIGPLLLAVLLLPACSATVSIPSTRPGPVAVGPARHLVILDGAGRRSAQETVFLELARQTRGASWFTVDDLSEDGHRVRLTGSRVKVRPRYPLEEESAGLRIDIQEWQAARNSRTVEQENAEGERAETTRHTLVGSVVLGVTLFDSWGNALLAEREYEGSASGPTDEVGRDEVIERSAADAVARFLADVTPRSVVEKVRLDDGDPGQREILEIARDGHVTLAARRMEAYAEQNPGNAAAAYNLAVLFDALGERYEALAWYDSALELGYRSYYAGARDACARRIEDDQALMPYTPPAALVR